MTYPRTLPRSSNRRFSKDKSELRYNDFLLLRGIPAAAYDYRLGNRSALEWVRFHKSRPVPRLLRFAQPSTDPRSGIVNDPNRPGDPKYILRLIGQVITVSLETQEIIATLPSLTPPRLAVRSLSLRDLGDSPFALSYL